MTSIADISYLVATKALPGAIEQINTSLENCPLLIESEAMAFANRGGPASMALPLTPQLTWEEEISSALQALELKVTGIESKIDFLYSRASTSNSQNTPWWYLTTLHRGIHTMSPYLIAGYIAMQLLGKLKK